MSQVRTNSDEETGTAGTPELLKRGGKESRAEALAKRREPIEKLGGGGDVAVRGNFVEKIAAERIEFVSDAIVVFDVKQQDRAAAS